MPFGDLLETAVYNSSADSTPDVAFADVTAGNLIVSCVFVGDDTDVVPNGDLLQAVEASDAGQTDSLAIGYRVIVGGDGLTWGWTQDNADQACLINREFEGPWEASPLDVTDTTAFADDQGTMVAGPTATTAQNDELIIAAWSKRTRAIPQTITLNSVSDSFINLLNEDNEPASASMKGVATATKVLTATGTPQTTGTFNIATNQRVGACMATFKKQAAAGTAFPHHYYAQQHGA